MGKTLLEHLIEKGINAQEDGTICLPDWAKRIKIDVGLSYTASNSVKWIREDSSLLVFGFEPLPESCHKLRLWIAAQEDSESLSTQLIVIQAAVGPEVGTSQLHVTEGDTASSSLLMPIGIRRRESIEVQVFPLNHLLRVIPCDRVKRIDYLKLDCQGMDAEILRGVGPELERIALVTAEAGENQYVHSSNSVKDLVQLMKSRGFIWLNPRSILRIMIGNFMSRFAAIRALRIRLPETLTSSLQAPGISVIVDDPTFVNLRYRSQVMSGEIAGFQKG